MNMNGLGRISFIISLSLTLLISGVILFYCVNRFKQLETNIIEQGKILQTFIIKAENQKCNLYSNIALESAKQQVNKIYNSNKIEVSDDEHDDCFNKDKKKDEDDDEDDDDDDDDDEDDDEDDDDDDDEADGDDDEDDGDDDDNDMDDDKDKKEVNPLIAFKNIVCEHLDNCDKSDNIPINIIKNNSTDMMDMMNVMDVIYVIDSRESANVNNITQMAQMADISDISDISEVVEVVEVSDNIQTLISNSEEQTNKVKKVNLNRLKLQELRDLVLQKNPDLKNNISNIKKEELIKMLNTN